MKKKWLHSQLWLHAYAHGICPSTHKILEFQADRIWTSLLLALEVSRDLCVLFKRICIKHSGKQQSQNSSQPITGLLKAQSPALFCTLSQRWNKATWIQWSCKDKSLHDHIRRKRPTTKAKAPWPPTFLALGTGFMEDHFFHRLGVGVGGVVSRWFKHLSFIVHFISSIITLWYIIKYTTLRNTE